MKQPSGFLAHGEQVSGWAFFPLTKYTCFYQKEIEQNARVAQDQGEYQKRADELAAEYDRLDAEVKAVEAEIQKRQLCGRRIETLVTALETAGEDFTVSLWGSMVEKVTVFKDALVFTLTSGIEVEI